MLIKLESLGYRTLKNYDSMLSRFHLIAEHHGQTDRQKYETVFEAVTL